MLPVFIGNPDVIPMPGCRASRRFQPCSNGLSIANRYLAAAETQSAVSTQPAAGANGSHVRQDMFRLASIRDCRAEIRAASSSTGMSFPVLKYISSGV